MKTSNEPKIEQPWNDSRLKLNGFFIGCVSQENADYLMGLEREVLAWRRRYPEETVTSETSPATDAGH